MREAFQRELRYLQDEILTLGSVVQTNLLRAAQALHQSDTEVARELIRSDEEVNAKRIELAMKGLYLFATQQPFASDMRLIAAVLEIVGELERIHDYVKGIAKITLMLGSDHGELAELAARTPEMAVLSAEMLRQALDAFAKRDAALARRVPSLDDDVDALFSEIYGSIIHYITRAPESFEAADKIGWAIHNLERAADRVINICEWIVYLVTGHYTEFDSEYEAPPG